MSHPFPEGLVTTPNGRFARPLTGCNLGRAPMSGCRTETGGDVRPDTDIPADATHGTVAAAECLLAKGSLMPPRPYWIGQLVFLGALVVVIAQAWMSMTVIAVCAVIQLCWMGARLWNAARQPWLALVPPSLTLGLSWSTTQWALRSTSGGDGAGLLMAMMTIAGCATIYIASGIGAGLLPPRKMP
jgi:hypothetical protein